MKNRPSTKGISRREFIKISSATGLALALSGLGGRNVLAQGGGIEYVNLGDNNMNLWPQLLDQFESQTGTPVTITNFPYGSAHDKFVTLMQARQLPDCAYGLGEWIGEFAERGAIIPPDEVFSQDFLDKFLPATLGPVTYQGRQWALPYYYSVRALYYRQDWLDEAGLQVPDTWDDVLNVAEALHDPPNRIGYALPAQRGKNAVEYFLEVFWPFGGVLLADDGKSVRFNEPHGVEALSYYKELANFAQPGFLNHNNDEVEAAFRNGIVAQTVNGPWVGGEIQKQDLPVPFGVALPPKQRERVALAVEDIFLIFRGADIEPTRQFAEFVFQDEVHLELDKTYNFVPVTASEASMPYYQTNELMRAFSETAPYGRHRPSIPQWAQINDLLAVAIQKALSGQATPQAALDEAAMQADALLR